MSFYERLREERNRLGLTQEAFGMICGVKRKAQIAYEAGERHPDSVYLTALSEHGVDVLYILTGRRVAEALSTEEKLLVERYRAADEATRYRILSSLLEGKTAAQAATDSNQVTQTITGMAGQVAGRDIKKR
ncbi:MAG: hypothetical protein B7X44_09745 [Halothiobacillus sp. 15-55-196]|jgi:transcriptional regulator with XRE-family HTH domain|nr:MAG: hypothetical protein B7X44_09745 [Halothiobacillus sp. 15-55-196]